jgi:MOSC domain-containing protein YiiM
MSRLEQIWIKRMHRGPMDPAERARVVAGKGIVGNANQGGKRQVTIVSSRHWSDVTAPLGDTPDPRLRRANLLVSDIDFQDAHGRILKIGGVRIRIYGETRPCEQMEAAVPGLKSAMSVPWGGGAFGEVLDDGEIAVGDDVTLT